MQDEDIQELLESLGYEGRALTSARQALEEEGLTRPGKSRIATAKVVSVKTALQSRFIRACSRVRCRESAASGAAPNRRRLVEVDQRHCEVCGGSDNRRAVQAMTLAMQRTGKTRLLVLGGTPQMRSNLQALVEPPCEVRFVFGDGRDNAKDALQNATWANLIVVLASTPIAHKVTAHYKAYRPITVPRRSITALAEAVSQTLQPIS